MPTPQPQLPARHSPVSGGRGIPNTVILRLTQVRNIPCLRPPPFGVVAILLLLPAPPPLMLPPPIGMALLPAIRLPAAVAPVIVPHAGTLPHPPIGPPPHPHDHSHVTALRSTSCPPSSPMHTCNTTDPFFFLPCVKPRQNLCARQETGARDEFRIPSGVTVFCKDWFGITKRGGGGGRALCRPTAVTPNLDTECGRPCPIPAPCCSSDLVTNGGWTAMGDHEPTPAPRAGGLILLPEARNTRTQLRAADRGPRAYAKPTGLLRCCRDLGMAVALLQPPASKLGLGLPAPNPLF
mmetsp:Transcript_42315/g.75808  ORF Transcript_42315/g.75808 Transcript_42315/m.75808 type:complete len:294 (-) Transcript_42315:78-959(-)